MKYIIVFFIFTSFFSCKEFKANQISIANYPNDKKIAVSFTFDDGCPSVFSTVVPLFDEYGYKATFFITPSQVKEKNWISWKALALKGYEIGNHSMSHRDLTELDSLGILEEVKRSKEMMEEKLKIPIFSFAPPHHKSNLKVDQVIFNYHAFSRAKEGFCKWYGWTSKTTQQIFSNDIEKPIALLNCFFYII